MTAGAAQAIVDDYELACAYRGGEQPIVRHVGRGGRPRRASGSPGPGCPPCGRCRATG